MGKNNCLILLSSSLLIPIKDILSELLVLWYYTWGLSLDYLQQHSPGRFVKLNMSKGLKYIQFGKIRLLPHRTYLHSFKPYLRKKNPQT